LALAGVAASKNGEPKAKKRIYHHQNKRLSVPDAYQIGRLSSKWFAGCANCIWCGWP
jgi:hypothetical protein